MEISGTIAELNELMNLIDLIVPQNKDHESKKSKYKLLINDAIRDEEFENGKREDLFSIDFNF